MMYGRRARGRSCETWSRAGQFNLFRTYDRPHFATTARVDVTALMTSGKSAGCHRPTGPSSMPSARGVHAVPALKMRFASAIRVVRI
jgi:chloramphenicol O-acetyltransferase type A